jgi:hypothetical protein
MKKSLIDGPIILGMAVCLFLLIEGMICIF